METVELEVDVDNGLIAKTQGLARRYFGDDSERSMAQVLELAFRMRNIWRSSIKIGQQDTDEPISDWAFSKSVDSQGNNASVQDWLFRR